MTSPPVAGEPSGSGGRAALLAAAHAELIEHGASALSLRAVARRAGLSHAAPKHHFGDRQGLLTALAVDGHRMFGDALRQAATDAPDDPERRLVAIGKAYVAFGRTHPALLDLMFRRDEVHADDPEYGASGAASFAPLVAALDGPAPDAGPPRPPSDTAMMAWALVHGLVTLARYGAVAPGAGDPMGALSERLIPQFVRVVMTAKE